MADKLTLTDVASLQNEGTALFVINNNSALTEQALQNTFSLDGTAPNAFQASVDVNSQQMLNLPPPATMNSPLRLQDLVDFVGGGTVTGLPAGGTTNQILAKNSNTDYDISWKNESVEVLGGSNITVTGTSPVTVAVTTNPTLGLSNSTGLPVTGVTGMGTGVSTFLATPSSANLAAALTDETGTGANVFATSPTLVTPNLGTPSSGNLTNCTGVIHSITSLTGSLGADVALNNVSNFFDGPSIAQGTSGTWFVSGFVTCADTAGASAMVAKLWDGTTTIASCVQNTSAANLRAQISLSGIITNPAGNLRISVKDQASTSGVMQFNASGSSKDCTITAIRIA